MKTKILKSVLLTVMLFLFSCQETVVTNIVHADGSVTRRIVIKDQDEGTDFKPESYVLPLDSTWTIKDTFEIGDKNDTTWIRTAEKLFKNVDEINKEYSADKGSNKAFKREARFSKKFRWFNTVYTFSENIEKVYKYGYPVEQYLTKTELEYFYLPDEVLSERLTGSDSTLIKQIADTLKTKTDKWQSMCLISEWKEEFLILSAKNGQGDINKEFLKDKDFIFLHLVEENSKDTTKTDFDTTLVKIMKNVFGDVMYIQNKADIDSAVKIVEERFELSTGFSGYSIRTLMPGELVATNGFIDKNNEMLWQLKSEFFMTEPYQMWAESKTKNTWAWVVSGVFLVFVVTGLVFRVIRKNHR